MPGGVAAIFVSQAVAGAGMYAWGLRRLGHGRSRRGQLKRALSFGLRGYAANALQVLNYRVDFFVLSAVASAAALGHYAVAVAVTSMLWLLPQALSDVLFPRVAALSAAEQEAHRDFVETKSLRHATLLAVGAGVVLALALLVLVVPVYGPAFRDAIALGLIRLPGVALIGIANTLGAITIGRGKPEYGLYTTLVVTPVTLVLYATLIPAYDATGAALASSLSFAAAFVVTAFFYRRATGHAVLPRAFPTRSELDDYRALGPKVRLWAGGLRARRSHAG
jgi:O-antigen/teichoic acid export membrane protein